jgi:hypothetical protein
LNRVYLDNSQNVHIVTSSGKDLKLTTTGHRAKPKLAPDGKTAAWVVNHTWVAPGENEPGSSELEIYRQGKTRSIKCEPFIREFWFWQKGRGVAIDCGGSHFAGHEILYDVRTLKELDSFDQAGIPVDKRPSWSISSDQFDSEKEKGAIHDK